MCLVCIFIIGWFWENGKGGSKEGKTSRATVHGVSSRVADCPALRGDAMAVPMLKVQGDSQMRATHCPDPQQCDPVKSC